MKERLTAMGRKFAYQESTVLVTAGRHIHIENCRRILEYHDIRIVLQLSDTQLHIWGSGLRADSCSPDDIDIYGDIQSVEWQRKGGSRREK